MESSVKYNDNIIDNKEQHLVIVTNSKNPAENCGNRHVFTEDFSVATILVVAYLIETIVQILLIVNCYRSLLYLSDVAATSSLNFNLEDPNWLWILFIGWVVTSLMVTLLSIFWTFRGMDFSGRVCGQMLCYLMHLFLLGFLWRYLKIALAYEKADVEEFFKLRKLQIYIQTFPLVAIHLAYLINYQSSTQSIDSTLGWMITGELLSSIISLSLHPLLKLKSESFDEPNNSNDHKHKPQQLKLTSATSVEINVTIKILFLISRVIVVGLLVSIQSVWPMLVIMGHLFATTFMWPVLTTFFSFNFNVQQQRTNTSMNPSRSTSNDTTSKMNEIIVRDDIESNSVYKINQQKNISFPFILRKTRHVKNSLVSSYTLFWDISNVKFNIDDHNDSIWCILSLPGILFLVEAVVVLIFHMRQCQNTILLVIVSGTCLSIGLLLFILMTTCNKWEVVSVHSCKTRNDDDDGSQITNETHPNKQSSGDEDEISDKITKFSQNTSISLYDQKEGNKNDKEKKRKHSQNFRDNNNDSRVVICNASNVSTSEISTTPYNYGQRINETLKVVKMQQISNNMNNATEMSPDTFQQNPQNKPNDHGHHHVHQQQHDPSQTNFCYKSHVINSTLSSTSSRNTNTISNLTLQNSPETKQIDRNQEDQPIKHSIYQNSSPLVIRTACKIQLNQTKQTQSLSFTAVSKKQIQDGIRSRCLYKSNDNNNKCVPQSDNSIYEKLIEDAYGILICEGELEGQSSQNHSNNTSERNIKDIQIGSGCGVQSSSTIPFNKKLRVLCAKCLGNHDPLLSNCCDDVERVCNTTSSRRLNNIPPQNQNLLQLKNNNLISQPKIPNQQILLCIPRPFDSPKIYSETTEYPTDTEFTCNMYDDDNDEVMSNFSNKVTYVNLPVQPNRDDNCGYFNNVFNPSSRANCSSVSTLFPSAEVRKEFTGMEYVKAWLLMNDVEARNLLNLNYGTRKITINSFNNKTSSLNRKRNCNQVSNKSKHISKYRKSIHLQSSPMRKQHPSFSKSQKQESSVYIQRDFTLNSKTFQNAPIELFNELHNDLLETIV